VAVKVLPAEREGGPDIWRVPSAGGSAERVTRTGGFLPYESADGQTLFFKRGFADSPLLALALPGGPERQVVNCVPFFGFAVGRAGVYHFGCGTGSEAPFSLLDATTGRDRPLGRIESRPIVKTTFALDLETVQALDELARRWGVLKVEALSSAGPALASADLRQKLPQ